MGVERVIGQKGREESGSDLLEAEVSSEEELDLAQLDDAISIEGLDWKIGFQKLISTNDKFRAAHYRLYKRELIDAAFRRREDLLAFSDCFDEQERSRLKALNEENLDEPIETLWDLICEDPKQMDKLMNIANERNKELLKRALQDIPAEALKYYVMLFVNEPTKMDMIVKTLEPVPIISRLKYAEYASIVRKVEEMMSRQLYEQASCDLMRTMPRIVRTGCDPSEWFFDFLEACSHDAANRTIPEFIDRDYKIHIKLHNVKRRMGEPASKGARMGSADAENLTATPLPTVDASDESPNRACRAQDDYKNYRRKTFSDERIAALPDPEPIQLRPYQEELVETAIRGVNTIICAPTGSGKTIVATYVIRNHLQEKKKKGAARVAMLVPTVPLVEQQTKALNQYLRKVYWLEGMSGSEHVDDDGRAPFVLASDVTVFTPQVFINLLKSVRKDDRLYFNDFTMFVFDECHHCDGDHPYNEEGIVALVRVGLTFKCSVLMRMLHDFTGPKPQVVGLTASLPLGSGRANVEAALDHMMDLCAKLSAHSISTVRKHLQNLQEHVTPPIDGLLALFKNSWNDFFLEFKVLNAQRPKLDPFVMAVSNAMLKIESSLRKPLNEFSEELQLRPDEVRFPNHREARYESFIGSLKYRIQTDMKSGSVKYQLLKSLEHLRYYFRTLALADVLPNHYAYVYLSNTIDKEPVPKDTTAANLQMQLRRHFQKYIQNEFRHLETNEDDSGEEKEIIQRLHKILREQYRDEPFSRTIIFVTTRMLAEKLCDHLNTCRIVDGGRRPGLRYDDASRFLGSNQSSSLSGQAAADQRLMIEDFNAGLRKILVATSVAEEGLDISACNLIIKYNNTGSERTLIQRRGRARAKNSRSILLALDGSIEKRELENIQKEELMRLCLKHIQTKSEKQMRELVEKKIKEQRMMRESELKQDRERRKQLQGRSYDICCHLCNAFICKSSDMRIACESHYVCCDPGIWERLESRVHENSKSLVIATLVGKAYCKGTGAQECREPLGSIVRLYGAFLPTITAKSIVVIDKNDTENMGRVRDEKKWDTISREKFFIEPITENDLKLMLKALWTYSKESHYKFETEAQMVAERALEKMKMKRKCKIKYENDD
ncbi:unnamed protein product [Anisakis simplex]|uniref:RNA helicase n=1 Tax=Anisakis simplex TaxID=6269 RepID=A0A0M3K1X2_ANISI|nr:unnamed protein product [Anisakis simplex]